MARRSYNSPALAKAALTTTLVINTIQVFLILRFIFQLLGANAQSEIVQFVYSVSAFFMAPFRNIFAERAILEDAVLDLAALTAIFFYFILEYAALALWRYLDRMQEPDDRDPDRRDTRREV